MEENVQLVDPDGAQAFLRRLPEESQRRGQARFRDGAVEPLTVVKPGTHYSATVSDAAWKNEVTLYYEPSQGWTGECTCPAEAQCAHVFAAMNALLAEHRMTVVRQLSTGQTSGGTKATSPPGRKESDKDQPLSEQLASITGRPIPKTQTRFLTQLHNLYLRCCQTGNLTHWDLQQLGLFQPNYSWAPLSIWPARPASEYEFWQYVANYLKEQKTEIPEFMRPVTDLTLIADRLARWRRSKEIEKWNQMLVHYQPERPRAIAQEEVDLRVMINEDGAHLQCQHPGQAQFETLRQVHLRRLQDRYDSGLLQLKPEAELIWQLFSNALDYGVILDIDSGNP